jgi:hypothetical protein
MDETKRYRLNAAECLLAAKTCGSGYRDTILSISACWHRLALQDQAMYTLLASWTSTQIPRTAECKLMAGGLHAQQAASDEV